ncbi:SAM-dependent methyltransferase [Kribbella italica]|uniref:SAM-dependent methyltransferase n=1 Tax=Kribbella italica TaxID=1540520 RepID=A0A7W9J5L9_9ACTN|nr:class I SAM-dependent methyltransferase [Kribbella italica]MBB5835318.1 SAM-dependent methyltransferase [Kribbella italica]
MTTEQLPDEWWNTFYAERDQIWSGKPNAVLVGEVAGLTPGRALDLGCGEGADAIWLAQQGWAVTGVDISSVALGRAAEHAEDAGVGDRIEWQLHELGTSFPDGEFDLVSAQFLHSKTELDRDAILRRAAGAVARGGVLLIEGHMAFPSSEAQGEHEAHNPHPDVHFPTPDEVVEGLALTDGEWEILVSEVHDRAQVMRDGVPITRRDSTVKVRRR